MTSSEKDTFFSSPTSMTDDAYLAEATAQRKHEEELARIAANERVEAERLRLKNRGERREFTAVVFGILGVVIVIAVLVVGIIVGVRDSHAQETRNKARDAELARTCVQAGGTWLRGDCVLSRGAGG